MQNPAWSDSSGHRFYTMLPSLPKSGQYQPATRESYTSPPSYIASVDTRMMEGLGAETYTVGTRWEAAYIF